MEKTINVVMQKSSLEEKNCLSTQVGAPTPVTWSSPTRTGVVTDSFPTTGMVGIPIDSGMGLSITIDDFRVFFNKTLSTQSLINQLLEG
jgi:hypothetical protein